MKDLGIDVELYISSEVDPDAIKVCAHKLRKICILQWNLSIEATIGTQLAVLYTVEPLYRDSEVD